MLLSKNVLIISIFSQILTNLVEYLMDKILVSRNLKKIEEHF
jgi:hypothetical protein